MSVSELPRPARVAAPRARPRRAARPTDAPPTRHGPRSAYVLLASGVALLPWLVVLALTLPQGKLAWTGLDAMEALGLILTGLLTLRRHPLRPVAAGGTAALLVMDAWFDVTTSAGGALAAALLMAVLAELPLAALCGRLAFTGARRAD
jgi:hypothetical protein